MPPRPDLNRAPFLAEPGGAGGRRDAEVSQKVLKTSAPVSRKCRHSAKMNQRSFQSPIHNTSVNRKYLQVPSRISVFHGFSANLFFFFFLIMFPVRERRDARQHRVGSRTLVDPRPRDNIAIIGIGCRKEKKRGT